MYQLEVQMTCTCDFRGANMWLGCRCGSIKIEQGGSDGAITTAKYESYFRYWGGKGAWITEVSSDVYKELAETLWGLSAANPGTLDTLKRIYAEDRDPRIVEELSKAIDE